VLTQSGRLLQFIRPADPVNRGYLQEAVSLARQHGGKIEVLTRASALKTLAESYLSSPGEGEQSFRDAYLLIQQAVALTRQDPSFEAGLADNLRSWGRVNRFLGHFDVDEASQREVYLLFVKHLGPDHAATASQRAIWAFSLMGVGKMDEAYEESQAALTLMRRQFPAPGSTQLWTNTAVAACASCVTARFAQCEQLAREALQTLEPDPQPGDSRLYEARSYLGLALSREGRFAEALPLLQQSVEFYRSRKRRGWFFNSLEQAYMEAQARFPVQAAK
jgi:tetratricopeptide (TPR) repeat protein